jgi:uncharacterized membrane protein
MVLESILIMLSVAVALALQPWRTLQARPLHHPWLATLALLPWLWASQRALPGGVALQMSGACLMVLMFGWPLTVLSLLPVAAIGSWMAGMGVAQAVSHLAWNGIVAASIGLGLGLAMRRWLPHHVFVFILGRGFIATAAALMAAGALSAWRQPLPPGLQLESVLVGHWLMAWGEAFTTGMLVAIFVAFKPQWLASWSDERYLKHA